MQVSERTYEEIAAAYPGRKIEIYDGEVRERPIMSIGHNRMESKLFLRLATQLEGTSFEVRMSQAPVRRSDRNYYLPDIYVVPRSPSDKPLSTYEVFTDPLPFIAEIWSPSTGRYDIDAKLPQYRARGDLEIWRLHPFEKSLRMWRRTGTGDYNELTAGSGIIELHALPGVRIDLDDLFNLD
jgi:Uma2 family endonuclease